VYDASIESTDSQSSQTLRLYVEDSNKLWSIKMVGFISENQINSLIELNRFRLN